MKIYGLLGKTLNHSFSPDYFKEKFSKLNIEADYRLFEIENINDFSQIISGNPDLHGLNVTIPYKQAVSIYLDELDEIAFNTGSVNTIKFIRENNRLILKGFNTDVFGFEKTILPFIPDRKNLKALILGTGGSSATVSFVLAKLKIPFSFVSRKPDSNDEFSYREINKEIIQQHHLIINTSPLGMFPNIIEAPLIPYQYLGKEHLLYDLIYNPAETEFLKRGKKQGAKTMSGLKMLQIQADESWKIWISG